MTEPSDVDPVTEPRRFGWLGWVMFLVAILLVGLAVFRLTAAKRLAGKIRQMEASGLPTSPAQLDAWYPAVSSPENNAARGILPAVAEIESSDAYLNSRQSRESEDFWESWDGTTELSKPHTEILVSTMRGLEKMTAELRIAAALSECRYDVDLSLGVATLLPHLTKVREAARILRYDAMAATIEGDTERALASTMAIFDLGRSLEKEPLMISCLVRIAIDAIAVQTLQMVVLHHELSTDQRSSIADKLTLSLAAQPAARGFAGEMACIPDTIRQLGAYAGMSGFGHSSSSSPKQMLQRGLLEGYQLTGLGDFDATYALEQMYPFHQAASEPDPAARLAKTPKTWLPRPPVYFIGSRMLLPAMDNFLEKELSWRALLLTARQALLPEDGVAIDPFTAAPMVSKTVDGYQRIYSLGPNGKDDGVDVPPAKMSRLTDDLYFMMPLADDAPGNQEGPK